MTDTYFTYGLSKDDFCREFERMRLTRNFSTQIYRNIWLLSSMESVIKEQRSRVKKIDLCFVLLRPFSGIHFLYWKFCICSLCYVFYQPSVLTIGTRPTYDSFASCGFLTRFSALDVSERWRAVCYACVNNHVVVNDCVAKRSRDRTTTWWSDQLKLRGSDLRSITYAIREASRWNADSLSIASVADPISTSRSRARRLIQSSMSPLPRVVAIWSKNRRKAERLPRFWNLAYNIKSSNISVTISLRSYVY